MAKRLHIRGLDTTKTVDELKAALQAALTAAAPAGPGIDARKILSTDVPVDRATGRPRDFGFVDVEDDVEAAAKTLTGKTIAGLSSGNLTVSDARPRDDDADDDRRGRDRDDRRGRDRDDRRGRDRDDREERPARRTPPATEPAATTPPATPAAPRRTTTPRTTPATRTTTTSGGWSCYQKILAALAGLLILAAIALAIVLPLALRSSGTEDPVARQQIREVNTRVDGLDQKVDQTQRTILGAIEASEGRLTARLETLERDNYIVPPAPAPAPTPAPAPVPPSPVASRHDGHRDEARGRSRNDEQDAAIAALRADLDAERQERARTDEVLANAVGTHVCRGAHQPVVCDYMAEHFGRQFE